MPKVVHQPAFSVIGIEVRTSSAKEATSEGLIGKQWHRIFQEGLLQKIPAKTDSNIYAVYSNYASDHNGEYSYTLGARVPEGTPPPAGFVLRAVPAGNYAVVTSEKGPVAQVVSAAWRRVWAMEDTHKFSSPRAYKADFELHDQRASDPQNAQVDLYIGLK
jgi:predicted transcriptional regulator YdeE